MCLCLNVDSLLLFREINLTKPVSFLGWLTSRAPRARDLLTGRTPPVWLWVFQCWLAGDTHDVPVFSWLTREVWGIISPGRDFPMKTITGRFFFLPISDYKILLETILLNSTKTMNISIFNFNYKSTFTDIFYFI